MDKLPLIKDNLPLKSYFFTIQTGPVHVQVPEECRPVLAYSDQEAFDKVSKLYPGRSVAYRNFGGVVIQTLLESLDLSDQGVPIPMIVVQEEKTKEKFINELLLVVDKYITDKRDQASIKRILNKINDGKSNPAGHPASGQDSIKDTSRT